MVTTSRDCITRCWRVKGCSDSKRGLCDRTQTADWLKATGNADDHWMQRLSGTAWTGCPASRCQASPRRRRAEPLPGVQDLHCSGILANEQELLNEASDAYVRVSRALGSHALSRIVACKTSGYPAMRMLIRHPSECLRACACSLEGG